MKKMKKLKDEVLRWIKAHYKELIMAGINISGIVAAVLLCKNENVGELGSLFESIKLAAKKPVSVIPGSQEIIEETARSIDEISKKAPHEVGQHIRNLSNGKHPSAQKILEAAEKNIELLDNQTIVDAYSTGLKTA